MEGGLRVCGVDTCPELRTGIGVCWDSPLRSYTLGTSASHVNTWAQEQTDATNASIDQAIEWDVSNRMVPLRRLIESRRMFSQFEHELGEGERTLWSTTLEKSADGESHSLWS